MAEPAPQRVGPKGISRAFACESFEAESEHGFHPKTLALLATNWTFNRKQSKCDSAIALTHAKRSLAEHKERKGQQSCRRKPVFNAWEPLGLKITVGNATHMKNVPGRKTDMNDSQWIAQLHRFGLIRPSFIPPGEFQRMRLLIGRLIPFASSSN